MSPEPMKETRMIMRKDTNYEVFLKNSEIIINNIIEIISEQ